MLTETQQRLAVNLAAHHFEHPILRRAILSATTDNTTSTEFQLLSRIITQANEIRTSNDPDLINARKLTATLPLPFSWTTRAERNLWTRSLLTTAQVINSEIQAGYYTDPSKINEGSIFRFFLLDGYARWVTANTPVTRTLEEERQISEVIVNALCEATVILAEQQDPDALNLLRWMNNQNWITKKWGFSSSLVCRANRYHTQ